MFVCFLLSLKYSNTIWLFELSRNMNRGYLYETINWLFETEKRYFRPVEMRCVERMSFPFKSNATCVGLKWLDQEGIFGSGLVSTDVAGKR